MGIIHIWQLTNTFQRGWNHQSVSKLSNQPQMVSLGQIKLWLLAWFTITWMCFLQQDVGLDWCGWVGQANVNRAQIAATFPLCRWHTLQRNQKIAHGPRDLFTTYWYTPPNSNLAYEIPEIATKMFIFDPLQVPQTGRNHGVPKDHLKGTPYSNCRFVQKYNMYRH